MRLAWRRTVFSIAAVLLADLPSLHAQRVPDTAGAKVVLVELFTSEGCSSCPPADALLRQVNGTRTNAGQLIVGISEHVTYWNSLGWSDPFSAQISGCLRPSNVGRRGYGKRYPR